MNPEVVGKSAKYILEKVGIKPPENVKLIIAQLDGVGGVHALSYEILAPILAFYIADDFQKAISLCIELNYHGGIGHSASIFSNDDEKIKFFAVNMNAGRICVNTPSSQGAVGGTFNRLSPSLTLGCGTSGKNITTDNVTAKHLLNIQRISRRRPNERFMRMKIEDYLNESLDAEKINELYGKNY
jgi:acetaldehyde dehydrogenase/alcohol dehydrogenase